MVIMLTEQEEGPQARSQESPQGHASVIDMFRMGTAVSA